MFMLILLLDITVASRFDHWIFDPEIIGHYTVSGALAGHCTYGTLLYSTLHVFLTLCTLTSHPCRNTIFTAPLAPVRHLYKR